MYQKNPDSPDIIDTDPVPALVQNLFNNICEYHELLF